MKNADFRFGSALNIQHSGILPLPAERDADRAAPKVEVAQADIEFAIRRLVLQRPEVADVAADADVVGEEALHAATDVDPPVVGGQVIEEVAATRTRTHQSETARRVGS